MLKQARRRRFDVMAVCRGQKTIPTDRIDHVAPQMLGHAPLHFRDVLSTSRIFEASCKTLA